MNFLNLATADSHGPAIGAGDIWAKGPRLRLVAIRRGKQGIFLAAIVRVEALLMRAKSMCGPIRKVLRLVEVARLVKDACRDVLRVLLQAWEAA